MVRPAASLDIAAPRERVWRILTDLDQWPRWGPSVRAARTDDEEPLAAGVRGTVTTVGGLDVRFVVTEFEPGRSWAWRVAGIPATGHSVDPTTAGCRVRICVPLLAAPYLVVCRVAVRRIARLATAAPG